MKKRIGVLFGGKSGEHEVSVQSAHNILAALNKDKYEPIPIGVDMLGQWHIVPAGRMTPQVDAALPVVEPIARPGGGPTILRDAQTGGDAARIDVFFPIAHGTFGEDGSLQGHLRLLNAPFVGAGVLGSAAAMDKDIMKRLFRDAGLPGPRFQVFRAAGRADISFDALSGDLGTPLFVKPCNLGSSVGISRVHTSEELERAIDLAFAYDRKIIIEENIIGREIECSVLGNDTPEASVPGEICVHAEFYSYQAKYLDSDGAGLDIPARLDPDQTRRVQELAIAAFQAVECAGMARVDFFLTPDDRVLLNEINTLPGFTRISMYPKLWEASGLPYAELLDRLIALALEAHEAENALNRSRE